MKALRMFALGVLTIATAVTVSVFMPAEKVDAAGDIEINEDSFPDRAFRQWVLENCDTDSNGYLSDEEIKKVTEIDCSKYWYEYEYNDSGDTTLTRISDLTGIKYFTKLKKLDCSDNSILSLNCSELEMSDTVEYIDCSSNGDWNKSLVFDISTLNNLKYFNCSYCNLKDIEIHSGSIEKLDFDQLSLKSLNLRACYSLQELSIDSKTLETLDLYYCTALKTFKFNGGDWWLTDDGEIDPESTFSSVASIDFTGCLDLEEIFISNTYLSSLNLDGSEVNCFKLRELRCEGNPNLTEINASNCTGLQDIILINNDKLSKFVFPDDRSNISWFYCVGGAFSEINLSGANNMTEFEYSYGVVPVSINLISCSSLTGIVAEGVELSSIDFGGCKALDYIELNNCGLETLNLKGCINLRSLFCYNNKLKELVLPASDTLAGLNCKNNQLTSLDISSCPRLSGLNCSGNKISSLDIRNNPELLKKYYSSDARYYDDYKYWSDSSGESNLCVDSDVTIISPSFSIDVESVSGCRVNVSKDSACYGEEITVRTSPANGYMVESIKINGTAIDGNTFYMPAEDVLVTVTIKKIPATPTPTKKPTATPTPTNKPTATPTPTNKPTVTATPTPTAKPTTKPTTKPTVTPTPTAKPKSTWKQEGGNWYYYDKNGNKATGWLQDGRFWYFLNREGVMETGWIHDGGKWYFLKGNGSMAIGWLQIGDNWFYLGPSGAMVTGWQKIGGYWYYFSPAGYMATGWQKIKGSWFFMGANGNMLTGWHLINGSWFYFDENGYMQTGFQKIDGKTYYMDPNGYMRTGWIKLDGKMYFFDASGAMFTGTHSIGGKQFNFASDGHCTNPPD